MRFIITAIFSLVFLSGSSQNTYPIKTIFKGDSVVIITMQQSEEINDALELSNKQAVYYKSRSLEYQNRIDSLNLVIRNRDLEISCLETVRDSALEASDAMLDSIWTWSLGPSLLYSQYPNDTTMYILDLSRYYLTTDDFGIFMPRMSDREYQRYVDYITSVGESPKKFAEFKNNGDFEIINREKIKRRKVWKYRKKSEVDKWKKE
jgi:hypothetical protein